MHLKNGVHPVHYNTSMIVGCCYFFNNTRWEKISITTVIARNLPPCEPQDVVRWQLHYIPGSMTSPPALASSTKHKLVTAEIPLVSRVGVAVHAWRRMNSNGRCPTILDTLVLEYNTRVHTHGMKGDRDHGRRSGGPQAGQLSILVEGIISLWYGLHRWSASLWSSQAMLPFQTCCQ